MVSSGTEVLRIVLWPCQLRTPFDDWEPIVSRHSLKNSIALTSIATSVDHARIFWWLAANNSSSRRHVQTSWDAVIPDSRCTDMSDRLLQEEERLVLSVERREERHRRQSCGSCSNIHRQPSYSTFISTRALLVHYWPSVYSSRIVCYCTIVLHLLQDITS